MAAAFAATATRGCVEGQLQAKKMKKWFARRKNAAAAGAGSYLGLYAQSSPCKLCRLLLPPLPLFRVPLPLPPPSPAARSFVGARIATRLATLYFGRSHPGLQRRRRLARPVVVVVVDVK
jgi:hypothetical protein